MKSLRELAQDYSKSILDKETYRKARSELLEKISSGEVEVQEHEYPEIAKTFTPPSQYPSTGNTITQVITYDEESTDTGTTIRITPKSDPSSEDIKYHKKPITIICALTIAVCMIGLIAFTSLTKDKQSEAEKITQTTSSQTLIHEFLRQKNWNKENLANFSASWQNLSAQEQAAIMSTPDMKRLTNSIHKQLLDAQALLNLGDVENSIANQQMLVNFAYTLGIRDKRLTILKPEPKVPESTD